MLKIPIKVTFCINISKNLSWFFIFTLTFTFFTANREVNEVQKLFGPVEYFMGDRSVEEIIRNMKAVDRAAFGFKCKDIIDMGRVLWLREQGLDAVLVKYVPHRISPENHLLLAKFR